MPSRDTDADTLTVPDATITRNTDLSRTQAVKSIGGDVMALDADIATFAAPSPKTARLICRVSSDDVAEVAQKNDLTLHVAPDAENVSRKKPDSSFIADSRDAYVAAPSPDVSGAVADQLIPSSDTAYVTDNVPPLLTINKDPSFTSETSTASVVTGVDVATDMTDPASPATHRNKGVALLVG
jgi:hypothetical protein